MADLLSVGLDVGTTTTQLILSSLRVENQASSFAVPQMSITHREVLYRAPVIFTPLKGHDLVDGAAIRDWVEGQYRAAGIEKSQVDTGAIMITGETSRKENAAQVLQNLSSFAGDFVVATAGPDMESVLAAKGAGALDASRESDMPILHMDIGGGTSNLALLQGGQVIATGCMNVGGRLLKLDEEGRLSYVSPVLKDLTQLQIGMIPTMSQLSDLATLLVEGLEMAAGLRPPNYLLEKLWTKECGTPWQPPQQPVILSFSGGVADCIHTPRQGNPFGDLGAVLGQAIRKSLLCQGEFMLGRETIGATVIGAGCHSTQLSGSTVYCKNVTLPMKNLPVIALSYQEQESENLPAILEEKRRRADARQVVIALPGYQEADYNKVSGLAKRLSEALRGQEKYICFRQDMAKACGQCLQLYDAGAQGCLCLDGLMLEEDSYLDIGLPVGPALPVVIKTLILSKEG